MIIFVSILAALLGGGHVGSTTRREIKFVASDYSFVDKKLWFTMPAIQGSCEPGNIWSNQSHDRATRNRFEIITCLVFRHVNSAHLSIKGIVAVDGVISDLDDNIGRRLASRVDKGDVETNALVSQQWSRHLGPNGREPRADNNKEDGSQGRPEISASKILGKATTALYFLLGVALLASCGLGHALSPTSLKWSISLVMFAASILVFDGRLLTGRSFDLAQPPIRVLQSLMVLPS
jgi:hypothetical protein